MGNPSTGPDTRKLYGAKLVNVPENNQILEKADWRYTEYAPPYAFSFQPNTPTRS